MSSPSGRSAAVLPPQGDGGGLPLSERSWRVTLVVHHVVFTVLVAIALVCVGCAMRSGGEVGADDVAGKADDGSTITSPILYVELANWHFVRGGRADFEVAID